MNCLLCGSENHHVLNRVTSFDVSLVYLQCKQCGFIFQSQDENHEALQPGFYAATYRRVYQGSTTPTAKDIWVQSQRAAHLIHLLDGTQHRRFKRILDVGASAGILLEALQRFYHSHVMGVEPGDAYRAYVKTKGLKMVASLEEALAAEMQRFDLITMIHVLEHLQNPISTLKEIREELLAQNGLLLLEVPNFYAHDSYELAHLSCFTPHSLVEMVKQAGYRVIFRQQHGVPRSTLLNLYITVMAEPLTEGKVDLAVQPDSLVRLKRRLGFLYRRFAQKLFPHRAWLPLPDEKLV